MLRPAQQGPDVRPSKARFQKRAYLLFISVTALALFLIMSLQFNLVLNNSPVDLMGMGISTNFFGRSRSDIPHAVRQGGKLEIWYTFLNAGRDWGTFEELEFKRHIVSLHDLGGLSWANMAVMSSGQGPESLVAWIRELGLPIVQIPEAKPCAATQNVNFAKFHGWCETMFDRVIVVEPSTLALGDLREMTSQCLRPSSVDLCGAAVVHLLPREVMSQEVLVMSPSKSMCTAFRKKLSAMSAQTDLACEGREILDLVPLHRQSFMDSRIGADAHDVKRERRMRVARLAYGLQNLHLVENEEDRHVLEAAVRKMDRRVGSLASEMRNEVPERVLYASLLTPAPRTHDDLHALDLNLIERHFLSMHESGKIPWSQIAIVYTEGAHPHIREWLVERGGRTIEVEPMFCNTTKARNARYKYQFTKLQLWKLLEYDAIVYTDLDTLVLGNINDLWAKCDRGLAFCAIDEPTYHPHRYFNGGVFIARPDMETYNMLVNRRKEFEDTQFCEQTYFNQVFTVQNAGSLDRRYNSMDFAPRRPLPLREGLIVHYNPNVIEHLWFENTSEDRDFIYQEYEKYKRMADEIGHIKVPPTSSPVTASPTPDDANVALAVGTTVASASSRKQAMRRFAHLQKAAALRSAALRSAP